MGEERNGCHPHLWPGGSFVKSQSEGSYYPNCLPLPAHMAQPMR